MSNVIWVNFGKFQNEDTSDPQIGFSEGEWSQDHNPEWEISDEDLSGFSSEE